MILCFTVTLFAATPAAQQPAFDVASVNVNNDVRRGSGQLQYSVDTLTARGIALWWVVKWAYVQECVTRAAQNALPSRDSNGAVT